MGSMALQLKPLTVRDPGETYQRALTLRSLMDDRRYRQLREQALEQKMAEDAREQQEREAFQAGYAGLGDKPTLGQLLALPGGTRYAIPAFKAGQEALEAERKAEKEGLEVKIKRNPLIRNRVEALMRLPSWADRLDQAKRDTPDFLEAGVINEQEAANVVVDDETLERMYTTLGGDLTKFKGDQAKAAEERATAVRAAEKAESEKAEAARKKRLQIAEQFLPTVSDQASYDRWKALMPDEDQAGLPKEYSRTNMGVVSDMFVTEQQRRTAQKKAAIDTPDKVIARINDPDTPPEEIPALKQTLAQMTQYRKDVRPPRAAQGAGEDYDALADTVAANPPLWDNLTPTAKTRIAPILAKKGFTGFGRPMGEAAVGQVAQSRSAIESLRDLRTTLQENEQYIGPVSGVWALNPYSDARQAQAKIDLVRQRVGKALEGGVLRKEDEEKYKRILATLQDTPKTAIAKVDNLIATLERDMKIFEEEQRFGGRRVPTRETPPAGPETGGVTVKAPNGKTYRFPNQVQADAFKKRAGIK